MEQITVIGASKGMGLETVKLALSRGFKVIAVARDFNAYPLQSENLVTISGDARNFSLIERSIQGSKAVIMTIGSSITFRRVSIYSESTATLLKAIDKVEDKPLVIAVTGFGAGDSKGHSGFFLDFFLFRILLRTGYEDKTRQEELIKRSNAPWIIVRPAVLTDHDLMDHYRTIDTLDVKPWKISRIDVANFIMRQVEYPDHLYKTPLLTYKYY